MVLVPAVVAAVVVVVKDEEKKRIEKVRHTVGGDQDIEVGGGRHGSCAETGWRAEKEREHRQKPQI